MLWVKGAVTVQTPSRHRLHGLTWLSFLQGTNEEKEQFLRDVLAAGVNVFNTAAIYHGPSGHNEELIGRAFAGVDRSSFVIATKFGVDLVRGSGVVSGGVRNDARVVLLR